MTKTTTTDQPAFVYALLDPRTDRVRYIGYSTDPWKRLKAHVSMRNQRTTYQSNWLKGLVAAGYDPMMVVVDQYEDTDSAYKAEQDWIAFYRSIGEPLTNLADGGRGPVGFSHSVVTKAMIGAGNTGKKHTEETKAKIGAAHKGKKRSRKTREKIAAVRTGKTHSEMSKVKMSVSAKRDSESRKLRAESNDAFTFKGQKHTDETKAKIGEASRKRTASAEARAKMSASAKAYWQRKKQEAAA